MRTKRLRDTAELWLILLALAVGMILVLSFYTLFGPWLRRG